MPRKRRRKGDEGARKVGEVLPGVLRDLGLERRIEETAVLRAWDELVGGTIAERSRARELREGKLFVEVENNVWMQEIRFLSGGIISKIRKMFPGVEVSDIVLRIQRERNRE